MFVLKSLKSLKSCCYSHTMCIMTINGILSFFFIFLFYSMIHPCSGVEWFCGEDRPVLGHLYFKTPGPGHVSPNNLKLPAVFYFCYIFVNLRVLHVLQTRVISVVPQRLPAGGAICKYMNRMSLISSSLYWEYRISSVVVARRKEKQWS